MPQANLCFGGESLTILLNGKEKEIEAGTTLAELIGLLEINPEAVVVEYNYELVRKETWDSIVLKENDRLEILRFVGGG